MPALKSSGDFIDYTNQFSRPAQPDQSNQQSYQQSHNSGAVDRQYTSYNSQPREQLQRSGLKSLHPNANQSMDVKLPKSTACEGVKPISGDYIDYNNQFSRQSATAKTFPPVHQEPRTWSQPPAKRFKATNDSGGGKGRWEVCITQCNWLLIGLHRKKTGKTSTSRQTEESIQDRYDSCIII